MCQEFLKNLAGEAHGIADVASGGQLSATEVFAQSLLETGGSELSVAQRLVYASSLANAQRLNVQTLGFATAEDPVEHGEKLVGGIAASLTGYD